MCELLYAGKTRSEIAGYDDVFMRWVLCRQRDENGSLVRVPDGLPSWVMKHLDSKGHWNIKNPQPYGKMFHQVMKQQGLTEEQREEAWKRWKRDNPGYGKGGE